MSIPQEILDLLRKLLVFEEGAKKIGSIHEAEVAATKIQELLLKYNIDRNRISSEERKYVSKYLRVIELTSKNEGQWVRALLSSIATYNFCELVLISSSVLSYSEFCIIGTQENVDVVEFLFEQLRIRIRELSAISWKQYTGIEKRNTYLRGFLMGASLSIRNRLHDEWEKAQKSSQSTTALILSNKSSLEAYKNSIFGKLNKKGYSSASSIDGYFDGKKVGKEMNIHKGLNKDKSNQNLIR